MSAEFWDPIWDDIYKQRSWGAYPEEALIRFIARFYYNAFPRSSVSILDLGCGVGAATWYLCREGFTVSAVDGSKTAVSILEKRLRQESLAAKLQVADINHLPYEPESFDCIVDVACLMCLDFGSAQAVLEKLKTYLKPGGRLLSYTGRKGCWGDGIGRPIGKNTYADAVEGPFAGMGLVRFSDESEILEIYGCFPKITLDYVKRSMDGRSHSISHWVVSCQV